MTQLGPESANPPEIPKIATIAGWVVVLIPTVVLAGWALNLRAMERFVPSSESMVPNSAVAALLAGIALLRRGHRDHPFYAALAAVIGALTLCEYEWSFNLGIDQLLFRDWSTLHEYPGRLSQYTAIGYALLGSSLLFMEARNRWLRVLSRGLAALAGIMGAIRIVSLLYDTPSPDLVGLHRNVSIPTAIVYVIGGIGVFYAHPFEGVVRLAHARNPGGAVLRRLLPPALIAVLLLGLWVTHEQMHFRWEFGFSVALESVMVAICLVGVALITATDLERKDMAFRESERRFRLAANSAPVVIWMAGPDRHCTYVNDRWLQFRGRTFEDELGRGWMDGIHPDDKKGYLANWSDSVDRREPFRIQYRVRRHDGVYRWMIDTGVPRFVDGAFAGYIGSVVDVTDHKLAEQATAELHRKVLEAQEEERSRIARELHDDINQRIAMLIWQLSSAGHKGKTSESVMRDSVTAAVEQLRQLANDIQAISRRLHSAHLEYLGLATAAGALCREMGEQQQVQINFKCDPSLPRLPKDVSLSLYRVLQEALQNAIKHSGVRAFCVELGGNPGEARLTVVDHGTGFDPQKLSSHQGLGLISMRERMRLVHGDFAVESRPGHGTTIRCIVPVPSEDVVQDGDHADHANEALWSTAPPGPDSRLGGN